MGTDIHIHMEYRSRKKKRHLYYGELEGPRCYGLFETMADVFYDEEPLFKARGLPGDVTLATLKEYRNWEGDAHHASWLTTVEFAACIVEAHIRINSIENLQRDKELEDLYKLLKLISGENIKHSDDWLWSYKEILDEMISYEEDDENCRIVFWFDN